MKTYRIDVYGQDDERKKDGIIESHFVRVDETKDEDWYDVAQRSQEFSVDIGDYPTETEEVTDESMRFYLFSGIKEVINTARLVVQMDNTDNIMSHYDERPASTVRLMQEKMIARMTDEHIPLKPYMDRIGYFICQMEEGMFSNEKLVYDSGMYLRAVKDEFDYKHHLKQLRIRKCMTMQEVSNEAGISRRTYEKYESRELDIRKAAAGVVSAIAKVLGTTVEDIVDRY